MGEEDDIWGEWTVWIPSLFSASVPRLFCGFVPSFLTNLKNIPFFLDLICAIIQRCFISGRGERAVLFSALLLLALCYFCYHCHCSSFSTWDLFLLLLFLGCHLFVCHDYYDFTQQKGGRGSGTSRLIHCCGHGARMESGGVIHMRVLVRENCCMWDMDVVGLLLWCC